MNRIETALTAARRASELGLSLQNTRDRFEVEEKFEQDFVSEADRVMEEAIRTAILDDFPGDAIVGEELGGEAADAFWSIDPVDGTANFLRGAPLWGVSLAYVVDGRSTVAVISLPSLGLLVSAEKGGPLHCNGRPVSRATASPIRIVAVGDNAYWPKGAVGALEAELRSNGWGVAGYRCATVALAFAALGYTDGYLEKWTNLWDVAAGRLLCERAGLTVSTGEEASGPASRWWIQAATPEILSPLAQHWADL